MSKISEALELDMQLVLAAMKNAQVLKFQAAAESFNALSCRDMKHMQDDPVCNSYKQACRNDNSMRPPVCNVYENKDKWTEKDRAKLASIIKKVGDDTAALRLVQLEYAAAQKGYRSSLKSLVTLAKETDNPTKLSAAFTQMALFFNQAATFA